MKLSTKIKLPPNPAIDQEYPQRLSELEAELRLHAGRKTSQQPLAAIDAVAEKEIDGKMVTQFTVYKKRYAAGHTDVTYSGSNHARGNRHICFYADGKIVLEVEGDFEDQQFGSNFRFHNIILYLPGDWESDFLKLTNGLRQYAAKRRIAFKRKRDAERDRLHRRHFA